jgi:hypothetical protein
MTESINPRAVFFEKDGDKIVYISVGYQPLPWPGPATPPPREP